MIKTSKVYFTAFYRRTIKYVRFEVFSCFSRLFEKLIEFALAKVV